jgi:hypothetical protein
MNLLISEYIKLIELHGTNINIPVNKKTRTLASTTKWQRTGFFLIKKTESTANWLILAKSNKRPSKSTHGVRWALGPFSGEMSGAIFNFVQLLVARQSELLLLLINKLYHTAHCQRFILGCCYEVYNQIVPS